MSKGEHLWLSLNLRLHLSVCCASARLVTTCEALIFLFFPQVHKRWLCEYILQGHQGIGLKSPMPTLQDCLPVLNRDTDSFSYSSSPKQLQPSPHAAVQATKCTLKQRRLDMFRAPLHSIWHMSHYRVQETSRRHLHPHVMPTSVEGPRLLACIAVISQCQLKLHMSAPARRRPAAPSHPATPLNSQTMAALPRHLQ